MSAMGRLDLSSELVVMYFVDLCILKTKNVSYFLANTHVGASDTVDMEEKWTSRSVGPWVSCKPQMLICQDSCLL